jgi:dihydroorotate dehydrogenase
MVSFMYRFLQLLPPETAHNMGLRLLRISPIRVNPTDEIFRVKTSFGILDNPMGLAAGYDKNASYLGPLSRLGFGYIVAGTVASKARAGKPKPRLVRYILEEIAHVMKERGLTSIDELTSPTAATS